ncbi:ion transporter [Rhodohalobacter sp. SW132]|uniref:ion transporter n=1 Tax=Rhodohalobacter sp. SW132 TaxID=2293433 RepID=UPI000E237B38|nr:ion transporter [Rhodohalobacter sp. SW132]REL38899.1 ion transporter [Rhodohalobacter sp. SW132]
MKKRLKEIVEQDESSAGRIFNLFIIALILLSVLSISIKTLPDLDESIVRFLEIFELVVVIIFTVEYVLRIYVADKKLGYIFSFYGVIDLIAILPFYIATGIDLRSLRIFRVLRLLPILKLVRYSEAASLLMRVFKSIRRELIVFLFVTICMLYVAAIGIYYFENPAQPEEFSSVFHSLWWSVSTFTLLGYGDVYPVTLGGRIFTFFVLITGIAMIALPTGLVAAALRKEIDLEPEE